MDLMDLMIATHRTLVAEDNAPRTWTGVYGYDTVGTGDVILRMFATAVGIVQRGGLVAGEGCGLVQVTSRVCLYEDDDLC